MGLAGVQRKEYTDLLASVIRSDRLYIETQQKNALDIAILLIEGRPQWTADGNLVSQREWTYQQHLGLICSIQLQGWWIYFASDMAESIRFLSQLSKWVEAKTHNGLRSREKPVSTWGVRSNADWGRHILQSFPNIGPTVAGSILEHFGGTVPLQWTCTEQELVKVAGVGKVRARKLMEALDG